MSAERFDWTAKQYKAIGQRDSDVLVAASAGTGKTAVLSARCVDILARDPECDIDNILLVTFTEAAAEQMSRRIARQLKERSENTADSNLARGLRRQLLLLQRADISTFHSFCSKLLRRHFYRLGIDPDFSIISEDEQMLLKADLLEKTVDWAWTQSDLNPLMKQALDKRDTRLDKGFLGNVIKISEFLDNVVSREKWLEKAIKVNSGLSENNELWKQQVDFAGEKIEEALGRFDYAVKLYREFGENSLPQDDLDTDVINPARKCLEATRNNDFDGFVRALTEFADNVPNIKKPKDLDNDTADIAKDTIKRGVDILKKDLSDFAILNKDYIARLSGKVDNDVRLLVRLVQKFDSLYAQAKQNLKCLDFADLEHKALRILTAAERFPDELAPSETALNLRKQYRYIFVDEYQDINSVQQCILKTICRKQGLFSVGDIKQSIYAFRGARPDIFIEELRQAGGDSEQKDSIRIDLSENFRSSKNLLDFVNKVFTRLVSRQSAGFDYDEATYLLPGSDVQKTVSRTPAVELHILDEESKTGAHKFSKRWYEVAAVAERIKQIVGADEELIFDKETGRERRVNYGDIAILLRAVSGRVNDYVQLLRLAGIPVVCPSATGFMEATEISDCLTLLKVLDNPLRDIEFAAVLRSPFFEVTEGELAKISFLRESSEQEIDFYECVCKYAQQGDDERLADKLRGILETLEDWREDAGKMNLADLLWEILRETGYLGYVTGLVNGGQRKANLLYLHDKAIEFAGFTGSQNYRRLSRFVEFIEKLESSGGDWRTAEPEGSNRDAVRIMSIHKSKGLEFPVVILADLGSEFNRNTDKSDCIYNERQTLGVRVVTPDEDAKVKSLGYQVISQQKKRAELREQMRILYVAMTRAERKLLLFGSQKAKDVKDVIYKGLFCGNKPVPAWQIYNCSSLLEWILYGVSESSQLHRIFETGLDVQDEDNELFTAEVYREKEFDRLDGYIRNLKGRQKDKGGDSQQESESVPEGNKTFEKIKENMKWEYPYLEYSKLDAKSSVTELTHGTDEYFRGDLESALTRKPSLVESDEFERRPAGKTFGTAVHLLLAEVVLQGGVSVDKFRKEKEKLVSEGRLSEEVADLIDEKALVSFFETEPGREALASDNEVHREWKFTFALPVKQWAEICEKQEFELTDSSQESVIVQGVVDMLIDTGGQLIVVDFKTDSISADEVKYRSEKYRTQLELYASAARTIMKRECSEKYLYFVKPGILSKV